jgi:formin 2
MCGTFDFTQLKALKEFLPTEEESSGLNLYTLKAKKSKEEEKAMADLCPCEKYMVSMMRVPDAADKFDCMLFETQFTSRIEEINESIDTLNKACIDVRESLRLRKLMAMVLSLVNQINTGGDGKLAAGFTLDALLKLDEVSELNALNC